MAVIIIADGNDSAVRLQADSMIIAYRNCHNILPAGYIVFAVAVPTASNDRAVGF